MQNHIAFMHPDLGIGGAEQLVVNLCLAAKESGLQPHIFTPRHHNSFPETHDGTIIIHQHGSFFGIIPDTIFGRLKGILAYIRTFICALWLVAYNCLPFQCVVVDQVSIALPILRLFGYHTIFYCHFPDKLLCGSSYNIIKRIYRLVINTIQQLSLIFAQKIYVNSGYTRQIFYNNYRILKRLRIEVQILYPSMNFKQFDKEQIRDEQLNKIECKYFLSLNRYQRKKNIELALDSFARMIKIVPDYQIKLVIAGGYDHNLKENIQYLQQLQLIAEQLNITHLTLFYTNISNHQRLFLLKNAVAVLYTPKNQHFGIVPCQAMYLNVPVIADKSGGPLQSIEQGCGYLCDNEQEWPQKMAQLLRSPMKSFGKQRMIMKFGFEKFKEQFMNGVKKIKK